jgi:transcription initiation factor TFIIB
MDYYNSRAGANRKKTKMGRGRSRDSSRSKQSLVQMVRRHRDMMSWRSEMDLDADLEDPACPDCGSTRLTSDGKTGDTICTKCGMVVSNRNIDPGKDWRAFTRAEESSRARCGLPVSRLLHDKGLPTRIGRLRGGSPEQKARSRRLYKTNIKSHSNNVERNLRTAFDKVEMVCGALSIGKSAKERSKLLYRKAVEMRLSRGRPMNALVCASLFVGCKKNETPKPLEEFHRFCDEKQMMNAIRLIVEELGINITASAPSEFVEDIAEKGCISQKARLAAYRILGRLELCRLPPSRDPRGFAAAALYIGCQATESELDQIQTQRDLATYASLTEVTVRNRIRDIKSVLTIKMPGDEDKSAQQVPA